MPRSWNELAGQSRPSWYLDVEVALQKRAIHQELIRNWVGRRPGGRVFKTDLFEDAWGEDAILFDLFETGPATLFATDIAFRTAQSAAARPGKQPVDCFVCDLRSLPIRASTFSIVISTSTLDHFASSLEFCSALTQICNSLAPGGTLVITLDNPQNPLYWVLRLLSDLGLAPFFLGYSPSARTLAAELEKRGLQVRDTRWLIHNPRLISTALVKLLRVLMGQRAGGPIRAMLRVFAYQEKLWPRMSACFYGVLATKSKT